MVARQSTDERMANLPESFEFKGFYDNDTLSIHNSGSVVNQFYQIHTPYLITYESCSGTHPNDYINFLTLSDRENVFYQDSFGTHEDYFRHRPPHFHDYFELMIVLEGSVTQKIEDRQYSYSAGACCLITRSLCHFETFNCRSKVLFLGLSVDYITKLFEQTKKSRFHAEAEFANCQLYKFILHDIHSPGEKAYLDFIPAMRNKNSEKDIHYRCDELVSMLLYPHFGTEASVNGAISSLLHYISDSDNYHCTLTELTRGSDFLIFSRISHILEENYGRISRSELANQLNYSGDYINRIINKHTGMCLSEYSMTVALSRAEYLIRTTNHSISDIALDLGFTNRTHFYQHFKERYHLTPKEYRVKHRKA